LNGVRFTRLWCTVFWAQAFHKKSSL